MSETKPNFFEDIKRIASETMEDLEANKPDSEDHPNWHIYVAAKEIYPVLFANSSNWSAMCAFLSVICAEYPVILQMLYLGASGKLPELVAQVKDAQAASEAAEATKLANMGNLPSC
jgi:hypothetical protein